MKVHLQRVPADKTVFQFLGKKRAEGKPYYVYMTAAGNKFLRHYYGKVMAYFSTLEGYRLWTWIQQVCTTRSSGVAKYPTVT